MGFEVYGRRSKGIAGDCYQPNRGYWGCVWDFVCRHCEDILTPEQMRKGFYNEGVHINEERAEKIAERLEVLVNDGTVKQYRNELISEGDDPSNFHENDISKFIEFLNNCGGFSIM